MRGWRSCRPRCKMCDFGGGTLMLKLRDTGLLRQQVLIGGEWAGADSGATIEGRDPANGELVGTVPKCGAAETRRAIAAAEQAQRSWAQTPAKERAAVLRRLDDLMLAN